MYINCQSLDRLADIIDLRHPDVLEVTDRYCDVIDAINNLNSVLDLDESLSDVRSGNLFERMRPRFEILPQGVPRQPSVQDETR